jgi:hypothetical protein
MSASRASARSAGAPAGTSLARPILVGGCPRSGTTLVGAMLGVGPDVLTVPEADFKWSLLRGASVVDGMLDRARVVAVLEGDRRFARWAVDARDLPATGTASYAQVLDDVVRVHGGRVGKPAPRVWVDHTPWNLKYAGTLAALLPSARFVHVVRDGRAVAASVRRLDWGPTTIDAAATWWAAHVAMGLAAEQALADRVVRVRYEDLVRDPEGTLPGLQSALGLPSDATAVTRREFAVDAYSLRQHRLVDGPPDATRVDAWVSALTSRQIETFERRTGDLLALLGYEPLHGATARSPERGSRLLETLVGEARRQLVDRPRRRWREHRSLGREPGGREP